MRISPRVVFSLPLAASLASCSVPGYWLSGPMVQNTRNGSATFAFYSTVTMVPYSALTGQASDAPEQSMLFGLANVFLMDGYKYVTSIDSADIIVTANVTNDYQEGEDLQAEIASPPIWREVRPLTFAEGSFGSAAREPHPSLYNPLSRSYPKFKGFVFDGKTKRCIRSYIAGGVARDPVPWHAAENIFWPFLHWLTATTHAAMKTGTGEAGFEFSIWSRDGVDYWPEITSLVPGFPAQKAGLQRGDAVLEVDGQSLKNITFPQALDLLRGEAGRVLHLKLWRYPATVYSCEVTMIKRAR